MICVAAVVVSRILGQKLLHRQISISALDQLDLGSPPSFVGLEDGVTPLIQRDNAVIAPLRSLKRLFAGSGVPHSAVGAPGELKLEISRIVVAP